MNGAMERLLRNPRAIENLEKAHADIDLAVWLGLLLLDEEEE